MRDFFKGWRRKAGVVALVMAVFLFGQWMWSPTMGFRFQLSRTVAFMPSGGCLTVVVLDRGGNIGEWIAEQYCDIVHHNGRYWSNEWRSSVAGVEFGIDTFGDAQTKFNKVRWCRVPFWEIILPLTLLSAYLLLWPQRKRSGTHP